jgi:hypothetical protein
LCIFSSWFFYRSSFSRYLYFSSARDIKSLDITVNLLLTIAVTTIAGTGTYSTSADGVVAAANSLTPASDG